MASSENKEKEKKVKIQSAVYFDDKINFSNIQKEFINTMIEFNSESLKDFYGETAPGYEVFLQNHQFTPEKEKVINEILKTEYDLNPYRGDGFKKPILRKSLRKFNTNKRKLSYIQPPPSNHKMTIRSSRIKSSGKTKKKTKKIKKRKKSYKK